MSDRVVKLIFLLLSCSWLSWSEHVDRTDTTCASQPVLRRSPTASTDQTFEGSTTLLIDDAAINKIAIESIPDRIWDVRGGQIDSTSIPSGATSVESLVFDVKTDTTNGAVNIQPDDTVTDLESLSFSLIQPGDGSQTDPDGIPTRFLLMQKGHRDHAIHALKATQAWREHHNIDTILSRPHPNYDVYKAIFPVFLAGRDPTGHIIVVEQLGKINDELAKRKNISMDEVLFHFVFMVEYCWNVLDKPPHHNPSITPHTSSASAAQKDNNSVDGKHRSPGSMVTIFDCQGVTISSILGLGRAASENRKFLIKFVQTISDHYPLRSYKTLIVNAPNWVHGIYYNLVRPLLRESSREKIKLFHGGKEQLDALNELGLLIHGNENSSQADPSNMMSDALQSMARKSTMEQDFRNFVRLPFFYSCCLQKK